VNGSLTQDIYRRRQPHVYSELVRYGLHTHLKTSNGSYAIEELFFKSSKGAVQKMDMDDYEKRLDAVIQKFLTVDGVTVREYLPRPHEPLRYPEVYAKYDAMSVQDRLDQLDIPAEDKELFESMTGSMGLETPAKIGFMEAANWFALVDCTSAGINEYCSSYKLGNGGTTSLAKAMLDDFAGDSLLNAEVRTVEQESNQVHIHLKDDRVFSAACVISTIPLNVLPDITFVPPLPIGKLEAAKIGHVTRGSKIHFEIKNRPAFFAGASPMSPFNFTFSDHNGTAGKYTYCIGFGQSGHLKDPENSSEIINRYQELVPDAEVSAYMTHNWLTDPYAKGAWCCYEKGFASKYLQILQEPHGRVLMASADWADGWRGFIDGAIEQGTKASRDAEKLLKLVQVSHAKI
jgi:hypothetical protein